MKRPFGRTSGPPTIWLAFLEEQRPMSKSIDRCRLTTARLVLIAVMGLFVTVLGTAADTNSGSHSGYLIRVRVTGVPPEFQGRLVEGIVSEKTGQYSSEATGTISGVLSGPVFEATVLNKWLENGALGKPRLFQGKKDLELMVFVMKRKDGDQDPTEVERGSTIDAYFTRTVDGESVWVVPFSQLPIRRY